MNERNYFFTATGKLKSWRDVVEPHPDVAYGRYKQAEFAADLAQAGMVSSSHLPEDFRICC